MKKIISVLLAAVMAFGLLPAVALAADSEPIPITADTYAGSSSVALSEGNYTIPANETVVIEEGKTWTLSENLWLYVYGKLEIKGTLVANGNVTAADDSSNVLVRCWKDGSTLKRGEIIHPENVGGGFNSMRYLAEVHLPEQPLASGLSDSAHKLVVKYMCSSNGSRYEYLAEGASFVDAYSSTDYDASTGMLKVPLNQYLFLKFSFTVNGAVSQKYDGDRVAILFNRVPAASAQGACAQFVDGPGEVEFIPASLIGTGKTFNEWKDSYFLRQERIFIPQGSGYSCYGVNGEASATDQTVYLNYGEEFKFRVKIDDKYSESDYKVYLVQGYKWNERSHEGTMESLLDEVYIDEQGNPQHFVWRFDPAQDGVSQKVYVDEYGVYHINSVEDEYTIVVNGVVSNDTLSMTANVLDTIRNLINALKDLFAKLKLLFGMK